MNLSNEIKEMVADILEIESISISESQSFKELGLDSFSYVELVAMLERTYKINIPDEMFPRLVNLDATVEVVKLAQGN